MLEDWLHWELSAIETFSFFPAVALLCIRTCVLAWNLMCAAISSAASPVIKSPSSANPAVSSLKRYGLFTLRMQPKYVYLHYTDLLKELVILWMACTLKVSRFSAGEMAAAKVYWFWVRLTRVHLPTVAALNVNLHHRNHFRLLQRAAGEWECADDMTLPSSGVIREVTASTTGHLKYVTENSFNNSPCSN